MWIFALLALSAIASPIVSAATDKVVCYYGSWSVYRTGNGKFDIENIDPYLCTHLMYGFVGINTDGSIRVMDTWNDVDRAAMTRMTGLRSKNPSLKALVAIGGWNEGSEKFSVVTSSANLRAAFVQNALKFIQTYGFDGFDLDWEYPSQRGGAATDKANFVLLLAEFQRVFKPLGYLVTAAVAASGTSVDTSYDVPALSKYLDFINVMTYDLHGQWDGVTGQNAPLYASSIDTTAAQKLLNVDASIRGWISRGADPKKIILGVGTYGRSFTLSNAANRNLGAPASNGGIAGQFTGEVGFLGYNEICLLIKNNGWTVVWDDQQKVPYAYSGTQWVGYDNPQSITYKVDYAKSLGLGGIMIWSVETDDFKGACGSVNPILNTINTVLGREGSVVEVDPVLPVKPTTTTTAGPPTVGAVCTQAGYMRDPVDCSTFYYCNPNAGSFIQSTFKCPATLVFDTNTLNCNYASEVKC